MINLQTIGRRISYKTRHFRMWLRGEITWQQVIEFFLAMWRYRLYYSRRWRWMIRAHILEQINCRIGWMDEECLHSGSCKICGCMTIALQMTNRPCEKPCYPKMTSKKEWEKFKEKLEYTDEQGIWRVNWQTGKISLSKS